ncbi:MAG: hypothetical protein IJZ68_08100 [Bacteroidaceae bacterium]|nr:hypothetical protein [Bacteroidaceae bacterium]
MLYWNQKRHYRLLSSEDRDLYIAEMSPMFFRKWMKRLNLLLNIATPLFLYFYLKLPLREIAFAFIAFDVILNVFEQVVFITLPWMVSKIPLVAIAQWQYNGISKNHSRINDRIDFLRKKHCENCDDAIGRRTQCTRCNTIRDMTHKCNSIAESMQTAETRLNELKAKRDGTSVTKPQVQTVTSVVPVEKPRDNSLIAYFQKLSNECNKLISTHRFDFLISVRKSADSMASVLKNKPEGEAEISGTLCYRLDNLIKLLYNLSAESDEVRNVYFEDAKNAANTLQEEMQQTISAINKLVPGVDTNTPAMLLAKINLEKEKNHV